VYYFKRIHRESGDCLVGCQTVSVSVSVEKAFYPCNIAHIFYLDVYWNSS